MLIMLLLLNWMFSIMFIFMDHPLSLGCILLIQTILIALITGNLYMNFWFSYILFLIMIGGMLVLFMYMTSVASNEKFKLPKKMLIFSFLFMLIFMMILIYFDKFILNTFPLKFELMNNMLKLNINFSLNSLYNYPKMQLMFFIIIYLLITLIAVVKIVGKNYGSLRQK